jgi:hypothetical protein
MTIPFVEFPKIARLSREAIVTEKIDGTNGVIHIADDFQTMLVGSRTRWITPEDDNYGFARWCNEHKDELIKGLGPGTHHGEWWGQGIQRNYGLKEKRFSLFNTSIWNAETKPACCYVVPVLYSGMFDTNEINDALYKLFTQGSVAAPGFMKAEGIVVFHVAANMMFKKTLDKNDGHKGI